MLEKNRAQLQEYCKMISEQSEGIVNPQVRSAYVVIHSGTIKIAVGDLMITLDTDGVEVNKYKPLSCHGVRCLRHKK